MRWFRRRDANARPREVDTAIDPEVGGDRIALWKTKEQVDEVDYGPIWIASANDPNETLEGPGLRLTWEEAEEFARRRGLPLEDA